MKNEKGEGESDDDTIYNDKMGRITHSRHTREQSNAWEQKNKRKNKRKPRRRLGGNGDRPISPSAGH